MTPRACPCRLPRRHPHLVDHAAGHPVERAGRDIRVRGDGADDDRACALPGPVARVAYRLSPHARGEAALPDQRPVDFRRDAAHLLGGTAYPVGSDLGDLRTVAAGDRGLRSPVA